MSYLQGVAFFALGLLVLPFAMRGYISYWKMRWGFPLSSRTRSDLQTLRLMKKSSRRVYLVFEGILAVVIFFSLLLVGFALFAVWYNLGPYSFNVSLSDVIMDNPLTVGVFLFLMFSFVFPWAMFQYVGVTSIRDTHQLCKEMRDCMLLVSVRYGELVDVKFPKK